MFIHQHFLRHLLRPEHYCSDQHFELELERLFRPAWQFVAAKSELPKDGDFKTLELFSRPIMVRNSVESERGMSGASSSSTSPSISSSLPRSTSRSKGASA